MVTRLSKIKRTNSLVRIISEVINGLASPLVLYSNYRRDLSEGKRNLRLDYLKERDELVYERRLEDYEQKLEKKLNKPERSEKIFRVMGDGIKYVGEHYDWEKEKRQAKAIGRGIGECARYAGREALGAGRKAKAFGQKEWQKEKEIMRERSEKLRQKKDELIQGKKEKLFLKFNKLKKDMTQIYNKLSNLDPEKNYNYNYNLKWQRDKLSKNTNKIADKLRKFGYPV